MTISSRANADEQVTLLLCSQLGLNRASVNPGDQPLSLREWNAFVRQVVASPVKDPGALLGKTAGELSAELNLSEQLASRVHRLLGRAGAMAIELERLSSRGIRYLTRYSEQYPLELQRRLRDSAPPVLFYAGDLALCEGNTLAIVGSRDISPQLEDTTRRISQWAARDDVTIVSGAARGADRIAMSGALDTGGKAVGVLADSLETAIRDPGSREMISTGRLLLLTPYHPAARFTIGSAMGRNKIVYGLSRWALVVSAAKEQGGTWAGAVECLRAGWTSVLVLTGSGTPEGNTALLTKGAFPFDPASADYDLDLNEVIRGATDLADRSDAVQGVDLVQSSLWDQQT